MEKQPLIFDVTFKCTDPENPYSERIASIEAAGHDVRCSQIQMDFNANGVDAIVLRIPMRYVNLYLSPREEMEYANQTDCPDL